MSKITTQRAIENDLLFEHFTALCVLPPAERRAAMEALALTPALHAELTQLLDADSKTADFDYAIQQAAKQSAFTHPIDANASIGTVLGDYRLLRELGHGGMGTVFLAERADDQYQAKVAIKLLRGFPTQEGMQRLKRERQILAGLDHPNIARLTDGGETPQGQPYLVMEYVSGRTLMPYLAAHALDLNACLALFAKLLNAVEHAHQRLVIHRDIKPGNVLIRDDGEPKLLDFGIAKLHDVESESQRQTSTRVWTEGYASPEQQRGDLITVATDVYSLGVVLREVLQQVCARSIPTDLISILIKATQAELAERYPTIAAFREDLQRFDAGLPVLATQASVWYRSEKFIRRHRFALLATAVVIALTAIFVWRLIAARQRAEFAEAQARAQTQQAKASRDFVVSLFQSANPINGSSENITALALLNQGRDKALATLQSQPALQAEMLEQLAQAYIGLSQFDTAFELAKQSAALTPVQELAHYQRAQLQHSSLARAGRFVDALQFGDALRSKAQQQGISDAALQVSMLNTRVMALTNLNRGAEAIADLQKILALLPGVGASETEQRAYALDNLSWAYKADGDFTQAIGYARQAEAAFIALRGADSLEPLNVRRHLASLLYAVGDPQAIATFESALGGLRKVLNEKHARLTQVQTNLALAYLREGNLASAQLHIDEARNRCAEAWPSCPVTLLVDGQLQVARGQQQAGLSLMEQALALQIAATDVTELSRDRSRLAIAIARCLPAEAPEVIKLQRGFLQDRLVSADERARGQKTLAGCHSKSLQAVPKHL